MLKMKNIQLNKLSMACILIVALFFTGCAYSSQSVNFSSTRSSVYKPNSYVNTGQSAAFYNEKVYYVSQEKGISGLYSMNNDGSEVRLEFNIPKVTRITVNDNGVYYVGLKPRDLTNVYFSNRRHYFYSFFKASLEDENNYDIEEISYPKSDAESSVVDGFVLDNGSIVIRVEPDVYQPYGSLTYIKTFVTPENPITGYLRYKFSKECIVTNENNGYQFDIVNHNSYLECYTSFFKDEVTAPVYEDGRYVFYEELEGTITNSFIDKVTNKFASDEIYIQKYAYSILLYASNEHLYTSQGNRLIKFDINSFEILDSFVFEDLDWDWKITDLIVGNQIFVIAKFLDANYNTLAKLYLVDMDSKKALCLAGLNNYSNWSKKDDIRLIHIGKEKILYIKNKKLICHEIGSDGFVEIKYEIKLPRLLNKKYATEIAGDWLFVYKIMRNDKPNKLIFRVNLETKEIIKQ